MLPALRARLEAEREALRTTALTDSLTGAANRRAFEERLDYEIARHKRQQHQFAVLVLDLDGFKQVNDRFGHPAGDEVLRDVATALRGAMRDQDTVARLGGDEFCLLAPETGEHGGQQLAVRVRRAVEGVTSGLTGLGASVGMALFPRDGETAERLIGSADAAQVEAKRRLYRGDQRPRERRAA